MPTLTVLISSRAGARSLAGWQCIQHELRRMPPALSGWRPRSPFSRAAAGTRNLAQSQAAEHRPDRRSEEQITCGLAQLTAGKERMTCATINYTRSDRGTVITIQSLRRGRHLARNAKIRTDPIPDLLRATRKCASGDLASVATNCEHRRSAWA